MSEETRTARRYQWFSSENLDLTCEPHTGVTCDQQKETLNLVARESAPVHAATVDFTRQDPDWMSKTWKEIALAMPQRHYITAQDVDANRLGRMFRTLHESQPETFKDLIQIQGVGARTIAALSLVSELVYNAPPSFKDPARFSFAHGGKDGHPFPVQRKTYEESIVFLQTCLDKARINDRDKIEAFKRLDRYYGQIPISKYQSAFKRIPSLSLRRSPRRTCSTPGYPLAGGSRCRPGYPAEGWFVHLECKLV